MFTAHEHRVHALRLLLLSMRTADPALHGRYERLSDLWLAVARQRERVDGAVRAPAAADPADGWRPIDTAPRREEIHAMATAWGPRIWLRNKEQAVRGRWRAYGPPLNAAHAKNSARRAGWEDLDRKPLIFAPTEWRELGGPP